MYKGFVYSYCIVNKNDQKMTELFNKATPIHEINIKKNGTDVAINVADYCKNEKDLFYFDFPFETKFNDFEYNHKNVLNFLEEKIKSIQNNELFY